MWKNLRKAIFLAFSEVNSKLLGSSSWKFNGNDQLNYQEAMEKQHYEEYSSILCYFPLHKSSNDRKIQSSLCYYCICSDAGIQVYHQRSHSFLFQKVQLFLKNDQFTLIILCNPLTISLCPNIQSNCFLFQMELKQLLSQLVLSQDQEIHPYSYHTLPIIYKFTPYFHILYFLSCYKQFILLIHPNPNHIMKAINEQQLERMKKMAIKNQQRCLNSQPFSRKRAYLNKQKCQQKIITMENQATQLDQTGKLFDEDREKSRTEESKKFNTNANEFESLKILKQLDHVRIVIKELQEKSNRDLQSKVIWKSKEKLISHSTRIHSAQSPKSRDSQYFSGNKIMRRYNDIQPKSDKLSFAQIRAKSQQIVSEASSSKEKVKSMRMTKIKSNKNMIKVYNPFPIPMAEFV